jgi:hypothetical protein
MNNQLADLTNVKYKPWGFKLNLMYSSIPPKFFRNIHNFNEFNAPRIDIGMLTASLFEQAIYGINPGILPGIADTFYKERQAEIAYLVKNTIVEAGVISNSDEIEFKDGMPFILPAKEIPLGQYSPDKQYPLFVIYAQNDNEGDSQLPGIPFLRILMARLQHKHDLFYWDYREIRFGRGDEQYQYKPFIFPPLFVAYMTENYTNLDFDYLDPVNVSIYNEHSEYYKVDIGFKVPYEKLINRETISPLNEYDEFVIFWDGKPARRSIVASQAYYDLDDDFQSAQVEAQLNIRIKILENEVAQLRGEIADLKES